MKEYIDKEIAQVLLRTECLAKYPSSYANGLLAAADQLNKLESADVATVVRCKDCEYWRHTCHDPITNYDYGVCLCDQWEYEDEYASTTSNDFCSYGERKNPNE